MTGCDICATNRNKRHVEGEEDDDQRANGGPALAPWPASRRLRGAQIRVYVICTWYHRLPFRTARGMPRIVIREGLVPPQVLGSGPGAFLSCDQILLASWAISWCPFCWGCLFFPCCLVHFCEDTAWPVHGTIHTICLHSSRVPPQFFRMQRPSRFTHATETCSPPRYKKRDCVLPRVCGK